jgi:hypothetical protein
MKPSIVFAFLLFACGGSGHEAAHAEHHAEHHEMRPELRAFHDVLAPVWHSEPGPVRATKACDASQAFLDKAPALGDPELISAVSELGKACMEPNRPKVEEILTQVHGRFHALVER